MTSTLEHEIAAYLGSQAQRVEVTDELDAIENDLLLLLRAHVEQRHRRLAPVLGVAAAVLLIGGLAVVGQQGGETVPGEAFGAAPDPVVDVTAVPSANLAPIPVATDVPVEVLLPDGAVLNGVVPSCIATADPDVFECSIGAFPEPLGTLDYTGYTSVIVDDTSHVSGGCRATNSDATEYMCYVGERAVEEFDASRDFLGQYSPREYAAG